MGTLESLRGRVDGPNLEKLAAIENNAVWAFVAGSLDLLQPASVFVASDAGSDLFFIRVLAL